MSEPIEDYLQFLADVLPDDYATNYAELRHDSALRRDFQVAAFEEGWLIPEWDHGLGGRQLTATDALGVRLAGATRKVPRYLNIQGVGVAAPALKAFGTPDQIDRLLRPALRGDDWWALGMSEPDAGSDLASLRTTATLRDDTFVVSGQKIWTTQADEARWCTLYVRTDRATPPHRGISCLILDMTAPGVDVRPIRTAGPSIESFCEVFLNDVEVPLTALLGELNGGWTVAMSSLSHERDMIWINTWLEASRALEPAVRLPHFPTERLDALGSALADTEAIRLTGLRAAAQRLDGLPADIADILKLLGSETVQESARLALETVGLASLNDPRIFDERLESLAATIYGGTSEIQRNIIAERILGLPKT